jgi:hypothetical protein
MQMKNGSAIVPIASSRRPADWPRTQNDSPFGESPEGTNAFGETPERISLFGKVVESELHKKLLA